jgi:hypothetical protein
VLGILFSIFSIISLLFLLNESDSKLTYKNTIEGDEYVKEVANIFSVQDFKSAINSEIKTKNLSGIEIPILIDDYIRKKYYNAGNFVDWHHNWFLYFLDFIFPQYYINTSMVPNDIISKDFAMCSQVSILFQDIVKDYGFDYASVRFFIPDFLHFALAVKVDDRWYFFDSNLEPKYDRRDPSVYDAVISGDKEVLRKMYYNRIKDDMSVFDMANRDLILMSEINTFPAQTGVFIQNISFLISWYGWAIFFLIGLFFRLMSRNTYHSN